MAERIGGTETVLVVDDDMANLETACDLLEFMGVSAQTAASGEEAMGIIAVSPPDVILLDVMMPGIDGYQVCQKLKASSETSQIPIIMLTALDGVEDHVRAIECGADDFMNKPFNPIILQVRLRRFLRAKKAQDELTDYRKHLEQKVKQQTVLIQHVHDAITLSLTKLVELRDPETGAHLERIRHYCVLMATKLLATCGNQSIDSNYINQIFRASILHDIGKAGIRDDILLKPDRLTSEEFEIMKTHCSIGGEVLDEACTRLGGDNLEERFLAMARDITFHHHEKYDGSGYPASLQGDSIPLAARIVAVADVFDALISRRPYKEPFPVEKALDIIREGRGTHFDPNVVDCFLDSSESVREIASRFSDESSMPA